MGTSFIIAATAMLFIAVQTVEHDQRTCFVQFHQKSTTITIQKTIFNSSTCVIQDTSAIVYSSSDMITLSNYVSQSISTCFVLSAVDKTVKNFMTYMLSQTHMLAPEYEFQSTSDHGLNDSLSLCENPNHPYVATFLQIALRLKIYWIAIFTQDGVCNLQFALMVKESILTEGYIRENVTFSIEVFKINEDSLMNSMSTLNSLNVRQRIYIALTPVYLTDLIFNYTKSSTQNQNQEVWVVKHGIYEKIPEITITYSETQQNIYKPVNNSETIYKCIWNDARNIFQNTIVVQFRQENKWQMFFKLFQEGLNVTIISYIGEIQLKETLQLGKQEVFKVVSIKEAPFLFTADYLYNTNTSSCEERTEICKVAIYIANKTSWVNSCCFGYTVDFLNILRVRTYLKFEMYLVEDKNYGGYNNTTMKFNGMVGDVIAQKADLAIAGLTITYIRANYVDFTAPFMVVDLGIITALNRSDANYLNWNFIANLGPAPRYTLIILFVTAFLTVYLFDNFILYRKWLLGLKIKKFSPFKWEDCFLYITGLMFQKDLGKINPSTFGGRTAAVVFAFAMVAWTTLYTASLTAEQVVKGEKSVFKGFEDSRMTNPTTNFKYGTTASTSMEDFFKNAPDEKFNRMYRFMTQNNYNVRNASDGIKKVISGELDAYINEYPFLIAMMANFSHCTLKLTPASAGQTLYGIAVKKGSILKDLLSQAIIKSQDDGDLNELKSKWMKTCSESVPDHQEFSLVFFATPLLLLACFIGFSAVMLLVEILVAKCFQKKRKILHISGNMEMKPPTWQNFHNFEN